MLVNFEKECPHDFKKKNCISWPTLPFQILVSNSSLILTKLILIQASKLQFFCLYCFVVRWFHLCKGTQAAVATAHKCCCTFLNPEVQLLSCIMKKLLVADKEYRVLQQNGKILEVTDMERIN